MNLDEIEERLRAFTPNPSVFRPFKAVFHMSTPISLAHPWINGDALISVPLLRSLLGEDYYTLPTKMPIPMDELIKLPLKRSHGVYHASASIFDTDKFFLNTFYKRFDTENVDSYVKSKKNKIQRGQGFFKDCMVRTPYKPCKEVTFYFNGDMALCQKLLENIPTLGKDRAKGYGIINRVEVTAEATDKSLFDGDICMRPIPFSAMKYKGIPEHTMQLTYKIPYWARNKATMCCVPGAKILFSN